MTSSFLFVCTNLGSEKALKEEVKTYHPSLHLAYSRPGFLTFKETREGESISPSFLLQSVLAQNYGPSFFKTTLKDLASTLHEFLSPFLNQQKFYLHTWEREDFSLAEETDQQFYSGLQSEDWKRFFYSGKEDLKEGDWVLDLLRIEQNEVWVGLHSHSRQKSLHVKMGSSVNLPAEAPSRTYLKMKEALLWSQAPVLAGDWAMEIGSSPGGSSYCLLQEGLNVVGVDTGKMDPLCLSFQKDPQFCHLQIPIQKLDLQDLTQEVRWLVLDVNLSPHQALKEAGRIARGCSQSLLGAFLTLKMNDWRFLQDMPIFLKQIEKMGFNKTFATQLPGHRQEILIYALTAKGLQRKN